MGSQVRRLVPGASPMKHTIEFVAWVLWYSASHGPGPDWLSPGSLEDVLSGGVDYQDATLAKDELEHGVRDLACAGLVSVTGDRLSITDRGSAIAKAAWAKYDAKPRGNFLSDKLGKRLRDVRCCAGAGGWSVTQEDCDAAEAVFEAHFREASAKAEIVVAEWEVERARHPRPVVRRTAREVLITVLKYMGYAGIGFLIAVLMFSVITVLGGSR